MAFVVFVVANLPSVVLSATPFEDYKFSGGGDERDEDFAEIYGLL